jgi:hypothetical protein
MQKHIIFISLIVGIVVGILLLVIITVVKPDVFKKQFSVVYLSTGDIYVGKLKFFPRLELQDAYLFQTIQIPGDPPQNTYQLAPLRDALWAPKTLFLERDKIIFYGPLALSSKAAETLRAAKAE